MGIIGPPIYPVLGKEIQRTLTRRNSTSRLRGFDKSVLLRKLCTGDTATQASEADPGSIDYALIRRWLLDCGGLHSNCLNPAHPPPPCPGFRLIDCKARVIVEASLYEVYTALSYVWGAPEKGGGEAQHGNTLPAKLPRTIEDAIDVTRKLGIQYLWVDRYCIDQNDGTQKHNQIRQMNHIYRSAFLTILAVAGVDSQHGLPRVHGRSRPKDLKLHRCDLESSVPVMYFHDFIRDSKWNGRAWTFQEAVLSTRKLVFTERHLYFECQELVASDSFQAFQETYPGRAASFFQDIRCKDNRTSLYWICWSMISAYVKRALTFDTDALLAFEGILQEMHLADLNLVHHFGIPIDGWVERRHSIPNADTMTFAQRHILATENAAKSFIRGLAWETLAQNWTRRRDQLPSWTWAGWKFPRDGIVMMPPRDDWEPLVSELRIEDEDGRLRDVSTLYSNQRAHHQQSKFIQIRARAIPVRLHNPYGMFYRGGGGILVNLTPSESTGTYFDARILDSHFDLRLLKRRAQGSTEIRGFVGIILGESQDEGFHMLLLRPRDGFFEKIGQTQLNWNALRNARDPPTHIQRLAAGHPFEGPTNDKEIDFKLRESLSKLADFSLLDQSKRFGVADYSEGFRQRIRAILESIDPETIRIG